MVSEMLSSRHYGVGHLMFQKCPHMWKLIFVHFILSFRYYFEGSSFDHAMCMLYIFWSSFYSLCYFNLRLYFVLSVILVCCMLSLYFLIYSGADICLFSAISYVQHLSFQCNQLCLIILCLSAQSLVRAFFINTGNIECLIILMSKESRRSLAGERGYVRLTKLQKKLRLRQQYMISQVSLLYPIKISAGPSEEQELESFPSSSTGSMALIRH